MRYELRSERALKLVIGQNNLNCKPIKYSTTLPPKYVSFFFISLKGDTHTHGEISLCIALDEDDHSKINLVMGGGENLRGIYKLC